MTKEWKVVFLHNGKKEVPPEFIKKVNCFFERLALCVDPSKLDLHD